jgi:restriction system protein
MARRPKRKEPDAFKLLLELTLPIFGVILLAALFFHQVLESILGLVILAGIALVCGLVAVALVLVIRTTIRNKRDQTNDELSTAEPGAEPETPSVVLDPLDDEPPSDEPDQPPTLEEKLRAIDWYQFEKLVSAIYEMRGCSVKRLGGARPDGGVDLIVEKDGERLVVQCKHWRKWTVGVRHIREILGAMTDLNVKKGVLVTLRACTAEAKEFADKHHIDIVDETELVSLMQMTDGSVNKQIEALLDDKRKFCPRCESQLILRTVERGLNRGARFWGCPNYPRCRYILRHA